MATMTRPTGVAPSRCGTRSSSRSGRRSTAAHGSPGRASPARTSSPTCSASAASPYATPSPISRRRASCAASTAAARPSAPPASSPAPARSPASARRWPCSASTSPPTCSTSVAIAATDRVAEALEIDAGDRVDGLTAGDLDDGSLYALLRECYGIHPALAEEVYRVAGAARRDAEPLGIRRGDAVFVVERITSDERGPFEYTLSTMRGDRYEIHSSLCAASDSNPTSNQGATQWPTSACTASSS